MCLVFRELAEVVREFLLVRQAEGDLRTAGGCPLVGADRGAGRRHAELATNASHRLHALRMHHFGFTGRRSFGYASRVDSCAARASAGQLLRADRFRRYISASAFASSSSSAGPPAGERRLAGQSAIVSASASARTRGLRLVGGARSTSTLRIRHSRPSKAWRANRPLRQVHEQVDVAVGPVLATGPRCRRRAGCCRRPRQPRRAGPGGVAEAVAREGYPAAHDQTRHCAPTPSSRYDPLPR